MLDLDGIKKEFEQATDEHGCIDFHLRHTKALVSEIERLRAALAFSRDHCERCSTCCSVETYESLQCVKRQLNDALTSTGKGRA